MSLQTIAPIRYVPFIIVYWNGKPYMQYDGERSYQALREFAIKVGTTVAQRRFKKFVGNVAQQPHNTGKPIPAYTVGKPVCGDGDDVCYLEFTDAYSGQTPYHTRDGNRHHKNAHSAYQQNGTFRQGQPNFQHAGAVPPQPR